LVDVIEVNFDKVLDCCFYRCGDTSQIADWFIKRAFSERNAGTILTQLKLQKCYIMPMSGG